MKEYFCADLKKHVFVLLTVREGAVSAMLVLSRTGVVLGNLAAFPSASPFSCFVDTKQFPWALSFLMSKGFGHRTFKVRFKDGYPYEEFRFKKEYF